MKKKSLIPIAAAGMILFSGCGDPAVSVSTYSYTAQPLSRTSEQNGRIVSEHESLSVRTELLTLPVAEVHCKAGQRVNKGDVLFKLDGTSLQSEIDSLGKDAERAKQQSDLKYQYESNTLEQAKESRDRQIQALQKTEQELQNAASQLRQMYQNTAVECEEWQKTVNQLAETLNDMQPDDERYVETAASYQSAVEKYGTLSETADSLALQLSQTEADLHTAEQNTESTRRELDQQIAEQEFELKAFRNESDDTDSQKLEQLLKQYDALTVTAPCSGIISECCGTAGQVCGDGLLAMIMPDETFSVLLYVPDQVILAVAPGQKATFRTDASEEEYDCTVTEVSAVRSDDGFSVRLQPAHQDGLLIGMQAYVSLVLEEKETYAVPNTAVCYNDDGTVCVYTAESNGDGTETAIRHEVKTGIADGEYIEIISDELQSGAQIILAPDSIYDGASVTLTGAE